MSYYKKNNYDKEDSSSISVVIIILAILLCLFVSGFTYIKNNRVKLANKIEEICPSCNGLIKFVGGTEYIIDINNEIETIIEKITINGENVSFEKSNVASNNIIYIKNEENINKGYTYQYDLNLSLFKFKSNYYTKEGFINFLNNENNFEFDLNLDDDLIEFDLIDNLDICFEDLIIDLGNKKVIRTYNFKFKNYIYIISFEDNLIVYDSSITPGAYYKNQLVSDLKMLYIEPTGDPILNLNDYIFKDIKYLDLDGEYKTPTFEINEYDNYDLITDDFNFDWFNVNYIDDYVPTLVITYTDLNGIYHEEIIGLLLCDYDVFYQGLAGMYTFALGEYERVIPKKVNMTNGVDVSDLLIIDDSDVQSDVVGKYSVYYKIKSPYSNLTHVKTVVVNIVE